MNNQQITHGLFKTAEVAESKSGLLTLLPQITEAIRALEIVKL